MRKKKVQEVQIQPEVIQAQAPAQVPVQVEITTDKPESRIWSDEEKEWLWKANASTIIAKFPKRTYQQIYQARRYFLKHNPTFIIPLVADFPLPRGVNNPVETVHNQGHVLKDGTLLKEPVIVKQPAQISPKPEPTYDIAALINNLVVKPKSIRIVDGNPVLEF